MLRPAPAVLCVPAAGAVGLAYALFLLGPAFLDLALLHPATPYWTLPEGYAGGPVDSRLVLSAYTWFVQDAWRWPLFHIVQANPPQGANAALMDPVPLVALAGKLLRGPFGLLNPYPAWVVACFALNAAALAALVRRLGQRSLAAALAAGAIGALAPLVHLRFGHFGLCGQWTVVLTLAASLRAPGPTRAALHLPALCALAVCVNLYLYVIAAAIAAAFYAQALLDRRLRLPGAALGLAATVAAGVLPLWAFGLLARADIAQETIPFGYASMNLLSPIWPQTSGLFSRTGIYALTRGSIGATPGQYEGYSYVGAGVLLLLLAGLVRPRAAAGLAWSALRANPVLAAALGVLTLWALSNTIYAGPWRVLAYPLPDALLRTVLAWFRAEGRFFIPVAWLISAAALAAAFRLHPPRIALALVALALLLQWDDLSTWRTRISDLVAKPPLSGFGSLPASAAIEAEIAGAPSVRTIPSVLCTARPGQYSSIPTVAGIELQLLAARRNLPMQGVVLSRNILDCPGERATPIGRLVGPGLALVLAQPPTHDRQAEASDQLDCRETLPGLLCRAR